MMGAIFTLEMKKNLQDKGLLFWMVILPIIFTYLFIEIFTSGADDIAKLEVITSIVPGYIVMFVFFIMISMVTSFIKDRDSGMTARIASAPIKPKFYLLGKWLPYILIACVQIFILFSFGKVVYDINLEQPILLTSLSIFLAYMVTGFGLFLALSVKTENMGMALTQVIALGGALISGLWVPIDMMPNMLQKTAEFLPQYWAHQALQDTMHGTLAYKDFFTASGVLFAYGTSGFLLAVIRYRSFLKVARS